MADKKEKDKPSDDKTYHCECIECGHEMDSEKHCRDIKCPECGGEMRRAERPGPGQKEKSSFKGDSKMKWYQITNKSADKAEIWIYEMIGEDFWSGGGVTAKNFQKELAEIKASQIDLHINSPGGVVFDGITIYNLIKQHPANVTTYIDGLAASIASVIALAGNKVIMAENALYMIHNPEGLAMGTATDMRGLADVLDKIAGTMITTYVGKSKKSESEIKAMLDAETWMTADEAKEAGFIDEIADEMDMAACVKFIPIMAKAGFKHIPKNITDKKEIPSEREIERALRDAGCSSNVAKTILARGYDRRPPRDEEPTKEPDPVLEPQRDVETEEPEKKEYQEKKQVVESRKKDKWAELYLKAERQIPSIN